MVSISAIPPGTQSAAGDGDPLQLFAAELRDLCRRSGGLSVRELERRLRRQGTPYPRSTVHDKLRGVSKPSWDFVASVVTACTDAAATEAELAHWRKRHRRLLAELDAGRPAAPAARRPVTAGRTAPHQLPAAVPVFRGRTADLERLDALHRAAAGTAAFTAVLSGTAGVGKTELAVQWGRRRLADFPDGQLFVDLRGYDLMPSRRPDEVLPGLLRALGDRRAVPPEVDEQAARFRSVLSGRRVLLVLDNARDADQVRPLLPGDPGCTVLVTTRDDLAGLVAREGAARVPVEPLSIGDATDLLAELTDGRVGWQPEAAALVAQLCARLPLALRVAAEAAGRHGATGLLDRLRDAGRRLDVLSATPDERTAVRTVLSWSYRSLPEPAARAFRLLALHPGPDFDEYAVLALTGAPRPVADRAVGDLLRSHLLQRPSPGRLRQHDLLRAYARERVLEDPLLERHAAQARLVDYYRAGAVAAMRQAFPADAHRRPPAPDAALPDAPADAAAALEWLDQEREVLVGVARLAADDDRPGQALALTETLWRYLDAGAFHTEAAAVHGCTLEAARRAADPKAEGRALHLLGILAWRQGRLPDAIRLLTDALECHRRAADLPGTGGVHNALGLVHDERGATVPALRHLEEALAIAGRIGEPVGQAATLSNLGRVYERGGDLARALECQRDALRLFRAAGDEAALGKVLVELGFLEWRTGSRDQAVALLVEARDVGRRGGDRLAEAWALNRLGRVHEQAGRTGAALDALVGAERLFDAIGNPDGLGTTRCFLGDLHRRQDRYVEAERLHHDALRLARDSENGPLTSMALNALAADAQRAGRPDRAAARYGQALAAARSAGVREEQERALAGLAATARPTGMLPVGGEQMARPAEGIDRAD